MNSLLHTIAGRDKCYKFLQYLEKFLSFSNDNPKSNALCWIIKNISYNIGLARHINKFGGTLEYIQNLKNKLRGKIIIYLSLNELFSISCDLLNIVDTFVDHLIFLCKINIIDNNNLGSLKKLSGIIWFLNISKTFGVNIKLYYKNDKLTLKEKCKLIQCILDYIILLNYTCQEYLLPRWIFGIFGMISCALSIYTKYLLK